jgi:hypothetical protein
MHVLDALQGIRRLIRTDRVHSSNNATLTVTETAKQARLKAVNIVSVGAEAFSIKYDECGFPSKALFSDEYPLHRGCDSVGFCIVDGKPFVLCIELKSSEPTRSGVAEQFRSVEHFLRFLDSLLTTHCRCDSIAQWERRYFVFHNEQKTPLAKEPMRDFADNSSPENPRFIAVANGERIYARKLLGRPL